jgi:chorismate mutase / prephenate dehydratase
MATNACERSTLGPRGEDIPDLRCMIDDIDDQILLLINRRLAVVEKIGRLKRELEVPIVDPDRETAVIERLTGLNGGPLGAEDLKRIFTNLMAVCRGFQAPS